MRLLDVVEASAELSVCGRYRYRLARVWGAAAPLGFVMLNPSTADGEHDDPTIRRCVGFARREGCGGIVVVNLFAWRSTDPAGLVGADDPVGPGNDAALRALLGSDARIVVAWGARYGEIVRRRRAAGRSAAGIGPVAMLELLAGQHERVLLCLGTSRDGSPRHPLMLRANQPLRRWAGGGATNLTCAPIEGAERTGGA